MGKGRDKKKNKSKNKSETTRKQKKESQGDQLKRSKKSKILDSSDDEDLDAIIESFKAKVIFRVFFVKEKFNDFHGYFLLLFCSKRTRLKSVRKPVKMARVHE